MQTLVIVLSSCSIVAGVVVLALGSPEPSFLTSVLGLALACGGFFFLVVAANGALDEIF